METFFTDSLWEKLGVSEDFWEQGETSGDGEESHLDIFVPHLPNSMWGVEKSGRGTNDSTSSPVCHLFFSLQVSYTL